MVSRQAHNLKIGGSNPPPATQIWVIIKTGMKKVFMMSLCILTTMMIFSQSFYDNPLMNSGHTIPVASVNNIDPYQPQTTAETQTVCSDCGNVVWVIWGKLYDKTSYGGYVYHNCSKKTPIGDSIIPMMIAVVLYMIYEISTKKVGS